jgi:predicted ATP-grasp superfamily ATP-dependent carboligase
MRDALASDFARSAFIDQIHLLHDVRLTRPSIDKQQLHDVSSAHDEAALFQQVAQGSDRTIIIAPEFARCLETRAAWASDYGATLLSPGIEFIRLTADKQQTAEHLRREHVPVPQGISWSGDSFIDIDPQLFPAVLKPLDGAGSTHVRYVPNLSDLRAIDLSAEPAWRLEKFHPGIAASVAYLSGPGERLLLPACSQRLTDDGTFQYLGGSTPLAPPLALRANRLAKRVSCALPATAGYVGIDMVLGAADNGAEDVVIEVNPRLTTSYLGLRQACEQNLAEIMWLLGSGERPVLSFRTDWIQFSPTKANHWA